MMATKMSSRAFNQDTSGAKKAARKGPVFIMDRGEDAFVLLSIDEYDRLTARFGKIQLADALAQPGGDEIEFEPVMIHESMRQADLS